MEKSTNVIFRATPKFKTELENASKNLGQSMSDLLRDALTTHTKILVSGVMNRIIDRAQPIIEEGFPNGFADADQVNRLMDRIYGGLNYQGLENLLLLDNDNFIKVIVARIAVFKTDALKNA